MRKISTPLYLVLSATLLACGGGGGGGGSAGPNIFSGKVLDGYISGALVCLDTNSNQKCDGPSIDPQTVTQSDGSYSFTYSGNVAGMHVIAEVPVGALDLDLGRITKPYSLLAPAEAVTSSPTAVITPLTTLVSSEMITNKASATEAEKAVKASLSLSTPLLGYGNPPFLQWS